MVERFELAKGLDLPISGMPEQSIQPGPTVNEYGIVASDYVGMSPTMAVSEGDSIQRGQLLFTDKKNSGVRFTSPVAGRVKTILRGDKRRFLGLELIQEGNSALSYQQPAATIEESSREALVDFINQAGLWTCFRTRPYGRVPSLQSKPHAIFVSAMDTNPLAPNPCGIIADEAEHFALGLRMVARLTDGETFVCRGPKGAQVPGEGLHHIRVAEFAGPHPAGLPGTHMHFLSPVSAHRTNWYLHYQDVIMLGRLWASGQLDATRVISIAGPMVQKPSLVRTTLGAAVRSLTAPQVNVTNSVRLISGSPLHGRTIGEVMPYLGRYDLQVTALEEGNQREFLGWQGPGFSKFSVTRAFAGAWGEMKKLAMTTSTGGSERAMVPIGSYERVVPLDLLPTLLLRALVSRDLERAQELGCLELEEEDLALCTFVCPGKYDFGTILRDNLMQIEKEG